MSGEESKLSEHHFLEDTFNSGNTIASDQACPNSENRSLERNVFGLALAFATEPSKLGQLRHMLLHLLAAGAIPEDFSFWAIGQIDDRLLSMALEYAHDAEIILQILSFKGGTLNNIMHDIEDLYRQEKISQRVYARAKLFLWEE